MRFRIANTVKLSKKREESFADAKAMAIMMTNEFIRSSAAKFRLGSEPVKILPICTGHINRTYKLICADGNAYIFQRINTDIFKQPAQLTENILAVTDFLRRKLVTAGKDPVRGTVTLIPTDTGEYMLTTEEGCIRIYSAIPHAHSTDSASPEHFENAAAAFGRFQNMLSDFPADTLHESIPRFHDTVKRLNDFKTALKNDKMGRAASIEKEADFILARESLCHIAVDALASGELPLRVTHNDTKLNNIMFDDETNEAVCVIDLDTVMPGSVLYDFGDAIRFGASTAAEDERNLSLVTCDMKLYEHFTRGFLSETSETLTEHECALLPESAMLLTLECGMRFLADYLDGDLYFSTNRPGQNLDRARTQLKLVADMEAKLHLMREITARYTNPQRRS